MAKFIKLTEMDQENDDVLDRSNDDPLMLNVDHIVAVCAATHNKTSRVFCKIYTASGAGVVGHIVRETFEEIETLLNS